MQLRKINFSLADNKKLAICENDTTQENQILYPRIVGFFGKNGVGKTRTLQAIYNTIQQAIENNDGSFLEGMTSNSKSKVLYLNAKEILKIREGNIENLHANNKTNPFNETLINSIGIQSYLIQYGKSLLYFMGAQWYNIHSLPTGNPIRVFFDMFSKMFGVEFRTIYDPVNCNANLEVNSLDIEFYQLSEGEWIAVFYLLLITLVKCTNNHYSDAIIIIDELENYLNPHNIREIFKGLYNVFFEKGQIWIASHSLDILLLFDSRNVFRLEKDKIAKKTIIYKPSMSNLEIIKKELYGNADAVLKALQLRENEILHYFIDFMTQSLQEPGVVNCISDNDIQLKLFLKCLGRQNEPIKILDFGAGQGRIGDALKKMNDSRINYYAYDVQKENIAIINKKNYAKLAFSKKDEITDSFDIILLCNVLHEIEPWKWEDELNYILGRLKKDGMLIFIEDLELPVGEYIDETGFLLLDGEMTQTLFGKQNVSLVKAKEDKYKDRILCAVISRNSNVTCKNIIAALEVMKRRNLEKIWQIRRNKKEKFVMHQRTLGTAMARASQLVVNAEIAINYLRSVDSTLYGSTQKFVSCFSSSLSLFDADKHMDTYNLGEALNNIWCQLAEASSEKWFINSNVTLTGSLMERLNHILQKVNLKMCSVEFTNFIEQYICLEIEQELEKDSFKELITKLVYLDLKNKFC